MQSRAFEYDPSRSAHITLLYADGERRYIIAPKGVKAGEQLMSDDRADPPRNCLPLRNIPVGSTVHCVELRPGKGVKLHVAPVPRCNLLHARANTRCCAFALGSNAGSLLNAVPRLARWAIASTVCGHWVKRAQTAGVESARRFAASL